MIRTRSEKKSLSTLIQELDGLFSEWLRRSNQIDGKCRCFICSSSGRWQDMQATEETKIKAWVWWNW